MNKIIFCQFSNKLLNPDNNISDKYYNRIWESKKRDGYWRNPDFWELPLWIAEICGNLKNTHIRKELHIVKNIQDTITFINSLNPDKYIICFSVLDINKQYIKEIISYSPDYNFAMGGYIDFSYFNGYNNIKVFKSVKEFIEYLGIEYCYDLDYFLFTGYQTIPRLTLSYGCLSRCKFCTVEKTIQEVSENDIFKQIEAFKGLRFKLIYLNDKTFGQTKNYNILPELFEYIKSYNSDFQGFIIQTTCIQIVNMLSLSIYFNQELFQKYIYAVEIGIETFNDSLLYELNKPQTELTIYNAMELLKLYPIKIILNIIIGIVGETKQTYNHTLNFLSLFKDSIYFLNIYNLAIYLDTPLLKEINITHENDLNENITDKSFYSPQQKLDNEYFYSEIFNFGMKLLC